MTLTGKGEKFLLIYVRKNGGVKTVRKDIFRVFYKGQKLFRRYVINLNIPEMHIRCDVMIGQMDKRNEL